MPLAASAEPKPFLGARRLPVAFFHCFRSLVIDLTDSGRGSALASVIARSLPSAICLGR